MVCIKFSGGCEIQTPPSGENDNNTQCYQHLEILKKNHQPNQASNQSKRNKGQCIYK